MSPRSRRWILGAILAAAALLRLLHFLEVRDAPFTLSPVIDSAHFQQMASDFAAGRLVGETAFQKGPLYPAVLGLLYFLFGTSTVMALGFQLATGVLTCYLIYRLGSGLFGAGAGLIAAGGAAVYGPFLFFEGQLLAAWLSTLLVTAFLLVLGTARDLPGRARATGSGLLLGLGCLVRGNLLVLVPFGVLWLAWPRPRRTSRAAAMRVPLFAAGCALALLPAVLHNLAAEGRFVLLTSTGGINLYTGNSEQADGYSAIPVHSDWELAMDQARAAGAAGSAEMSSYWTRRTLDFVRSNPASAGRLLVKKLVLFWDAFEYPNNVSFGFYQRISRVLRWPLAGFGLVAPLGLWGLIVLWRSRRRQVLFLGLFLAFYTASVILFFACDRYRILAVPPLLCLGGGALTWAYRRLAAREYRPLVLALAPLTVAALFVNLDLYGARPRSFCRDWTALGDAYRFANRLPQAIRAYGEATVCDPDDPDPRALLGECLARNGRRDAAEQSFLEALRLNPAYSRPRSSLALLLFEEGRIEASAEHLRYLKEQYPSHAEPRLLLGDCYRRQGRREEAEAEYRAAAELDADLRPVALARIAALEGRGEVP